jgi:two-component system phosphate regulon sensor histidine kinase PhoR
MNFSTKNISPNQLSAITSVILSVPVGVSFFFVTKNWIVTLSMSLIIFLLGYFLIHAVLERFIFRKIKLIYKLINQKKANKKEEMYYKYILPKKSIDEVRLDVENWAQRNKAEMEILENNEAYRKEFLQNLAHELKTPIFAIQGYVDTLLDGAIDNPAVNKKFLENASHNIERMVNLVNDLDEISKLESGVQPVNKQNFLIQDLIKEFF